MMQFDWSNQNYYKLPIKEKSKISFIDINEILYLQCDGYITTLYFVNKQSIGVAKLLKQFEEELGKYGFLRANHHTLINIRYINTLKMCNQERVIHIGDVEIKISRRKFYLFKEYLNEIQFKRGGSLP
jgi:DNA-binding LytR/AlgR family response regulator